MYINYKMYTILFIGKSNFKFKYININSKLNIPDQRYTINKLNSANSYIYNDSFDVIIKNSTCYITRTDKNEGWNIELKIYIKYLPNNDNNIILSMTTLPERLNSPFFRDVYEALLNNKFHFQN